jgi:alpha-glucoside transport system permease protein
MTLGQLKAGTNGAARALGRTLSRLPLHAVIIGIALLWMVPTVGLLVSSFRPATDVRSSGWWNAIKSPLDFTLDNYADVLSEQGIGQGFINSLTIAVPSTVISILVAALAAYAFAWMRFPGRNLLFLLVVALLVVPIQMTLIPVLRLYVNLSVDTELPLLGGNLFGVSSFPGIWLAHTAYGLPFAVFLLRNFFGALPRDLFESAYLDGASDIRVFFRIVLPLSVPAIAALTIFQFLWIWNDLLVAFIYLNDPDLLPLPLVLTNLVGQFGREFHLLTAAAFISMALPLAIFFALQRYFVEGILTGSVKG